MSKVVAIDGPSAERVKAIREEAIAREIRDLMQNDESVRDEIRKRITGLINGMTAFDISYKGGYMDICRELFNNDEDVRAAFKSALLRCLESKEENAAHWRIYEVVGQAIAEKMKIEIA